MAPWRLPSAFREGVFRLSWSLDRRQSMVAIGDIVEVALLVLKAGQRHYGATYELCSEGRFTASDIGETIDRKSVVSGKSVSVRVDLCGRRIIKKKNRAQDIEHE